MSESWNFSATYIEFCSCDPGCGCNFTSLPTSPEGNCFALTAHHIDEGVYGRTDLGGCTVAWALWWPGAIHEKGGHGHVFIDCANDDQFAALSTIYRGEAGYPYFEIFNSTFVEPTAVERATVEIAIDGKNSTIRIDSRAAAIMEPLRSPVTGDENDVRIVKDKGFIWKDGAIAQGKRMMVNLDEMSFETSGRHAVVASVSYSA
ncbi:MAG: DUF1326 domain-containing protein [Actinomycetota bacterium]